jgi:hypothetical protein
LNSSILIPVVGVLGLLCSGCAESKTGQGDQGAGTSDLSAVVDQGGLVDGGAEADAAVASDLGKLADLQPPADLARTYVSATVSGIYTGSLASSTYVSLSNLVLTTPVVARPATGGCTYRAWAQDPNAAAPAGISLYDFVPSSSSACPPSAPFAGRTRGENVQVKGRLSISTHSNTDGGQMLVSHSISVDSLTPTGGTTVINPTMVDDPSLFTGYGAGFQQYEGMLVSLGCGGGLIACTNDGGKLKVKYQPNPYLWGVTGFALFGSTFANNWPGKPGPDGTTYSRIIGVVNSFLTGSLEPRDADDFVP